MCYAPMGYSCAPNSVWSGTKVNSNYRDYWLKSGGVGSNAFPPADIFSVRCVRRLKNVFIV